MPAPRRRFRAVPRPDAPVCDVDPQRPAGAVAQDAALPVVCAEASDQRLHRDAIHRRLLLAGRTAARGLRRRNVPPRRLGPDPRVAMTISTEDRAHVVQAAQEGGLLAVAAIHPDPAEPHPPRPRRTHPLKRKIGLAPHHARFCRDLRPVAAGRVVDPALRQVEPPVDRGVPRPVDQHGEHRHLTGVQLAQAPTPRPGHANRAIARLDEALIRFAAQASMRSALSGLAPSRRSASRPICSMTGSCRHGALLMKCWNRCAQPSSTTTAIAANLAASAWARPCR